MKIEFDYFGIHVIPENYSEKYCLIKFCKEAEENEVDKNLDLQFIKEQNEKKAGGSCSSADFGEFFDWESKDETHWWVPMGVDCVKELLIQSEEL